jgi:hypothetical protein
MLFKVFYTDSIIQSKFSGQTYGPFIFIRPSKRSDIGLLEHEKVHVKQFWSNPLFGLWYLFSKKSRAKFEAEAYCVQLKYSPGKEDIFANHLATKYNLGISHAEALAMLST